LNSHLFVSEAAVCAKWDEVQGTEVPVGYVVLSEEGKREMGKRHGREIREWVDGKVGSYKRLRGGVEVIESIPKTSTGKVLRRLLPARLVEGGRRAKI
jgi:4-coumarate--CoA ligase